MSNEEKEVVAEKAETVKAEKAETEDKVKTIYVRMCDHELRDKMHSQGMRVVKLPAEEFATTTEQLATKRKLLDENRMKNKAYDAVMKPLARVNNALGLEETKPKVYTQPKIVVFPDVNYADTVELRLDPNTGNTVALIASSKAGKTQLMMHIYQKYFTDYISVLFAQNAQLPQYKQKNLIRTDEYLPKIIDICRRINKVGKNKFDFLFMFDDMVKLGKGHQDVTDLFLSLRNSNISSIISLQYLNLMAKSIRGNVNNILAGAHNSDENCLVLIKCYLSSWMKKMGVINEQDQILYYRQITSNHGFILINPTHNEVSFVRLRGI